MQDNTISATAAIAPTANGIDQAQFEADKRAVYKHPLFSLLALLLEKCEQATQGYLPTSTASNSSSTSNSSSPNGTNGNCDGDSFSRDIQAFVQMLEKEKRPLLTNDSELDGLMIKALQVLRIHLLELEKVQELCRDFCTRYIACLRGKMQSENLLRADYPLEHSGSNLSNSNSPTNSPVQDHMNNNSQQGGYYGNTDFLSGSDASDFNNMQVPLNFHSTTTSTNPVIESNTNNGDLHSDSVPTNLQLSAVIPQNGTNSVVSGANNGIAVEGGGGAAVAGGGSVGLGVTGMTANDLQTQSLNTSTTSQILGSTPLSQIGCPPLHLDQYSGQLSPCGSSDEIDSEQDSNNDEIGSNFSNSNSSKRQKRGILPKHATSVMRAWLFQHLVHPYPTEDEKRAIAAQTNLTLLQVNNWFINARRRILQPMLEHANDSNSRKKHSPSPPKRFWSDNATSPQPLNPALIVDPTNIENISANINRADSERSLLLNASHKLANDTTDYYSSDSNESLVIDQDN